MITRTALTGVLALVLAAPLASESQLEKRGTYSVHFWWRASGEWFQIERDHSFFVGRFSGTFFNDAGEGFLQRASAVCPGVRDVVKGFVNAHAYCVMTDDDDDKATFVWICKGREHC